MKLILVIEMTACMHDAEVIGDIFDNPNLLGKRRSDAGIS